MPVMLFVFLLSLQSLINSGVAQSISFPELVGPDGRILTFADLCNATDENQADQTHCKSCVNGHSLTPSTPLQLTLAGQSIELTILPELAVTVARPEANQARRRAPPSI